MDIRKQLLSVCVEAAALGMAGHCEQPVSTYTMPEEKGIFPNPTGQQQMPSEITKSPLLIKLSPSR